MMGRARVSPILFGAQKCATVMHCFNSGDEKLVVMPSQRQELLSFPQCYRGQQSYTVGKPNVALSNRFFSGDFPSSGCRILCEGVKFNLTLSVTLRMHYFARPQTIPHRAVLVNVSSKRNIVEGSHVCREIGFMGVHPHFCGAPHPTHMTQQTHAWPTSLQFNLRDGNAGRAITTSQPELLCPSGSHAIFVLWSQRQTSLINPLAVTNRGNSQSIVGIGWPNYVGAAQCTEGRLAAESRGVSPNSGPRLESCLPLPVFGKAQVHLRLWCTTGCISTRPIEDPVSPTGTSSPTLTRLREISLSAQVRWHPVCQQATQPLGCYPSLPPC